MEFEDLLLLTKAGNEDVTKLLLGKKLLDKLANKISKMSPSKKDKLLAMLLAEKIPIPELQEIVNGKKEILLKELLSEEGNMKTLEMPKKVGEIGGKTVSIEDMEKKESKEEKSKEEDKKKSKKEVVRLSDL